MEFWRLCAFVLLCWTGSVAHCAAAGDLVATKFQVLTARNPCPVSLPSSPHPYGNLVEMRGTNTCPGATAVELTFDPRSSLEPLYDYVYVTDAFGTNVEGSPFTATELAGRTVVVPGDTAIVRLDTDGAVSDWGFAVLSVTGLSPDPNPTVVVRQPFSMLWEVRNLAIHTRSNEWSDSIFISTEPVWTSNALPILTRFRPELPTSTASYLGRADIEVPSVLAGDYYLILRTDIGNEVLETNEINNNLSVPIHVVNADLAVFALNTPTVAAPQQPISISWAVTNVSTHPALPHFYDFVYFRWGTASNLLDWFFHPAPLPPGCSYSVTQQVTLTALAAGSHELEIHANAFGVPEILQQNNVLSRSISIQPPNLIALRATGPTSINAGDSAVVSITVSNAGPVSAYPFWNDAAYLSPTNRWTPQALWIGQAAQTETVQPGQVYTQHFQVIAPGDMTGDLFLLLRTDSRTNLFDANAENNVVALPIQVRASDLAPTRLEPGSKQIFAPNEATVFRWVVENRGSAPPPGGWIDRISITWDAEGTDILMEIGDFLQIEHLGAASSYNGAASLLIPALPAGQYFLMLTTDYGNQQPESDETNNVLITPITISAAANLAVEGLRAPASVTSQQPFTVSWTVRNLGPAIAYPPLESALYIALPGDPSQPWLYLVRRHSSDPLIPGASYSYTETVELSSLDPGNYLLVVNASFPPDMNMGSRTVLPIRVEGPDLVALAITAPTNGLVQGTAEATLRILNIGSVTANPPWTVQFYISETNRLAFGSILIGSTEAQFSLPPGESATVTMQLQLRNPRGRRYLAGYIDPIRISDPNPENNDVAVFMLIQRPDLQPQSLSVLQTPTTNTTFAAQQPLNVQWVIRNRGDARTLVNWRDAILLSSTRPFPETQEITSKLCPKLLLPNETYLQNAIATLPPVRPGRYDLIVQADSEFDVEESDKENNKKPLRINIVSPDLALTQLSAPSLVDGQSTFEVSWTVRNAGAVHAFPSWGDRLFISTTNRITPEAIEVAWHSRSLALATNNSYAVTQFITLPRMDSINCYLIARTYDGDNLFDSFPDNNELAIPLSVRLPDLAATHFGPLSQGTLLAAAPQSTIGLSYMVGNFGIGAALGAWYDQIYFSRDNVVDSQDTVLAVELIAQAPLNVPGVYSRTVNVRVPTAPAGNYFLILKANDWNTLGEATHSNNSLAIPITLAAVDLELASIDAAGPAAPNATITVTSSVRNNGPALAMPAWSDRLVLARNPTGNSDIVAAVTSSRGLSLAVGNDYTNTTMLLIPEVPPGNYYLIARTDADNDLSDAIQGNNFRAVPLTIVLPDLVASGLSGWQTNGNCPGTLPQAPSPAPPNTVLRWTNNCPGASNVQVSFDVNSYLTQGESFISIMDKNGAPIDGSPFTGWIDFRKVVPGDRVIIELSTGSSGADHVRVTDISAVRQTTNLFVSPQGEIDIQWTVTNSGAGSAASGWVDQFFLSSDARLDISDILIGEFPIARNLAPAAFYGESATLHLDAIPSGQYHLLLKVDGHNGRREIDETNNIRAVPIAVGQPADLRPLSLIAPAILETTHRSPAISLNWTVTNQGVARAAMHWVDNAYLSRDSTLDSTDTLLTALARPGPLDSGQSYKATQSVTLQLVDGGLHYLLLCVDGPDTCGEGCIYESDEANNMIAVPIQINAAWPDLVVTELVAPELTSSSQEAAPLEIRWVVRNQGPGIAIGSWSDTLYINGEPVFSDYRTGPLAPGESYTNSLEEYLSQPFSGTYSITVSADDAAYCNCVPEVIETNNSRTTSVEFARSPKNVLFPGEPSNVPLWLLSPSPLATVEADLFADPRKLSGFAASFGFPKLASVTMTPQGLGRYRLRFETLPGQDLVGQELISQLHFQALHNQPSSFVPILISNVVARTDAGQIIPRVSMAAGRVVVIRGQPLLETTLLSVTEHLLTIYGLPGSNVIVETQDGLAADGWTSLWEGTLTNRLQHLGPYAMPDGARFYRARY